MKSLDTKILINNRCELLVASKTDLFDKGFVYLEFLISDNIDAISTLVISKNPEIFKYFLDKDGLYIYYRLKVPVKSKLQDDIEESRLYFDDSTDKLMIGAKEVTDSLQLENIINDSVKYGISDKIVEEPIFSICKISACLENLQRKYIFERNPDLTGSRCKEDSDKLTRDFLFSSVFILRLLIGQQRYEEALRILESITQCSELCNITTYKTSCGCK